MRRVVRGFIVINCALLAFVAILNAPEGKPAEAQLEKLGIEVREGFPTAYSHKVYVGD